MNNKTVTVSNTAQLAAALKVATGGETINLNTGNYGDLSLYKFTPASMVTIQSAAAAHAVFTSANLNTVANLTFDNIEFARPLAKGDSVTAGSIIYVVNGANLNFTNLDIHGSLNHNPMDDKPGMFINGSHDIQIAGTKFHDLYYALKLLNVSATAVTGSTVYEVREGINVTSAHHLLLDHNLVYDVIPNYVYDPKLPVAQWDHPDMIQFFTTGGTVSDDVTISNNALLLGKGMDTHGIFIKAEDLNFYSNFLIENNLVSTNNFNGISIDHLKGAIVRDNTVLTTGAVNVATINVAESSAIKLVDNITTNMTIKPTASVTESGTVLVHVGGVNDSSNILKMFANPLKIGSVSIDDFAEIAGGRAATSGAGFDIATFKSAAAFAVTDTLMHALDNGSYLHHIA